MRDDSKRDNILDLLKHWGFRLEDKVWLCPLDHSAPVDVHKDADGTWTIKVHCQKCAQSGFKCDWFVSQK
jgi:hypothetical protein